MSLKPLENSQQVTLNSIRKHLMSPLNVNRQLVYFHQSLTRCGKTCLRSPNIVEVD